MIGNIDDIKPRPVIRDAPFNKNQFGPGYDVNKPKPRRRMKIDPRPSGIDDGKAGKRMIFTMLDEVLDRHELSTFLPTDEFPKLPEKFRQSHFLEKLKHPQLESIPSQYQLALQKAIKYPVHSSEMRRRLSDIQARLKRNDGGMVRCKLNSEQVDDGMLKMLTDVLPLNIYLQHLMLHDNYITDKGLEALCNSLKMHPSIHTLYLGANQISDLGVRYLTELIKKNPNIKDINLSNKWPFKTLSGSEQAIHPHVTPIGADLFARVLTKGCALISLTLAEQRVCDPGAVMLFKALKYSKLRSLNLKGNDLTDNCTQALHDALKLNPALEQLTLSINHIKNGGANKIAEGLKRNNVLVVLDLERNEIGDIGMKALADSLIKNKTIYALSTSGNESQDTLAEDLAASRKNPDCNMNMFGDIGSQSVGNSRVGTPMTSPSKEGYGSSGRRPLSRPLRPGSVEATASREAVLAMGSKGLHIYKTEMGEVRAFSPYGVRPLPMLQLPSSPELENDPLQISAAHTYLASKNYDNGSPDEIHTSGLSEVLSFKSFESVEAVSSSRIDPSRQQDNMSLAENFGDLFEPNAEFTFTLSEGLKLRTSEGLRSLRMKTPSGSSSHSVSRPGTMERKGSSHASDMLGDSPWKHTTSMALMPRENSADARKSSDLGRTLGIPHVGSFGSMPIRSAGSRHRDSGQHMMYLRIATPADPPDAKPYSLMQIAKDREAEIKRVKLTRQDPEYKIHKKEKMGVINPRPQRAALRPPPEYFWEQLKRTNHLRYDKGIDQTTGCTSTQLKDEDAKDYFQAFQMGMIGSIKGGDSSTIMNAKSSGQALTLLRQRNKIKMDFENKQAEKKVVHAIESEKMYLMNDGVKVKVNITDLKETVTVDTLQFILSGTSLDEYQMKFGRKKLKAKTNSDSDEEEPKRMRRINPRYDWGINHLCADGSMPVASFSDNAVCDVREAMGFNKEAQEKKRLQDEAKEKARLEEEARIKQAAEDAAREKARLEEDARRAAEEEIRIENEARLRREEKQRKRKEARDEKARLEADAKERQKKELADELARREALKQKLKGGGL